MTECNFIFVTSLLHFLRLILGRGRRSGSVVSKSFCRLHLLAPPAVSHVPVHKIAPSPSGSASWSLSGDLHVHHLSEVAFLLPTVHMPKPSETALPCFAFYTPYPQLFSDIFTLHFLFHCHPLDFSQHSHFCLL